MTSIFYKRENLKDLFYQSYFCKALVARQLFAKPKEEEPFGKKPSYNTLDIYKLISNLFRFNILMNGNQVDIVCKD